MSNIILSDAQARPDLFSWNGSVDRIKIASWLEERRWSVPADLLGFWAATGGGTVFETERLLAPARAGASSVDEMLELTTWLQKRGLPSGLAVFHQGLGFTAVRAVDAAYVSLDSGARVVGEASSFDQWYTSVIRSEYAYRYDLPTL
jgi:hypothetical protein